MAIIKIDPLTRIEGHMKIETNIEPNTDAGAKEKFRVQKAYSSGLMFRGIEVLLEGRDPMDAYIITQRICGVCPLAHGIASSMAQEAAYRAEPTDNGRLLQNLIFVSNWIQSHILHFYHLVALDYVDVKAILQYKGSDSRLNGVKDWVQNELKLNKISPAAPFLPRFEGDYIDNAEVNIGALANYLKALEMRTVAHEMTAVFGGKMPHVATFIPTGVTSNPEVQRVLRYQTRLDQLIEFINTAYLPDVLTVAKAYPQYFKIGRGPANFLCYGAFRETNSGDTFIKPGVAMNWNFEDFSQDWITEDVGYSYYASRSRTHPFDSETKADPNKAGAYSWLKAPRYKRKVMQVGPLARTVVQYLRRSNPDLNQTVDKLLQDLGLKVTDLNSVMGRHAARAIECKMVAERARYWLDQLKPGEPSSNEFEIPKEGRGFGGTEAPRGAVGHWLKIKDHLIERYQCVVPTTWNCSPRDDDGQPSAVEQALEGTAVADQDNPIELGRIVRSFDPCLACSVH